MWRSVQVLRGIAACSVGAMHAYGFAGPGTAEVARLGAAGVDLFFVISGFIMATIPKKPTFLFDRFWRIFPMWLIAVTPWLVWDQPGGLTWIASLTLLPVASPALVIGWTLSFELLFYVGIWASGRTRQLPIYLYGCALALGWPFLGSPMILEFLMGVAIAHLPKDERLSLACLIGALMIFIGAPTWVYDQSVAFTPHLAAWRVLFWGVPAALIVYGALSSERLFQHRAWAGPVLLGNASYSIYLFHLAAIRAVYLHWIAELIVAVLSGVAIWWSLERPILKLSAFAKPKLLHFGINPPVSAGRSL